MDLTELFETHPRPWWIGDNEPDLEGQLCVFDANRAIVIRVADMEDADGDDLQIAELLVFASRVTLTQEPWTDTKTYWDYPKEDASATNPI